MESEQIDKQLAWLDEQRRKDSDVINRLTERLTSAEENVSNQNLQLQEMSSELARLAALATRIHQMDEALTKHRQEVSRQLKDSEKLRSKKEKALEKLRVSDQKALAKKLDDVRSDVSEIDRIEGELDSHKKEEIRISRTLDALNTQLEDYKALDENRAHTMASLEEVRRKDSNRIGELQAEMSELRVKSDTLRGEFESAGDRIRRNEVRISEIEVGEKERSETQMLWVEQQGLKFVEFERSWKLWETRFEEFERQAKDLDERMLSYEETYRGLKQLSREFNEGRERLERRIQEVTEMHRLNADRLQQEWATFLADDQKRWNTYKLTTDEQWREHTRLHEKMSGKIQLLEENTGDALQQLLELHEADQRRLSTMLTALQEWASESS
jgi:chromosome segregation ATPase